MGAYKNFKTSTGKEKEGIVLDFGTYSIRIARAGGANERYTKRLADLLRPHRKALQLETADPKVTDKLVIEAYAETIILGWENMTDENDKPLDFSKENVIKVMTDLPDLFNEVMKAANTAAHFRADIIEGDAKN